MAWGDDLQLQVLEAFAEEGSIDRCLDRRDKDRRDGISRQWSTPDEEFFAYGEDADWCLRARGAGWRLLHAPGAAALHRVSASAGTRTPLQSYLLARARVLLVRRHAGAAARRLLFWPWMLLVRGPHDFAKALLTRGWGAAWAGVRGLCDGARGGAPRRFRAELGLDGGGGGA